MGMPIITPCTTTPEQAITDLVASIGIQESALSHIINAEGEKMQAIIGMEGVTSDQLLTLNESVERLLKAITGLELTLQAKLELVDPFCATPGSTI
ncbi:MAG: hypothetical protein E7255_07435 [Lachnospiraceae bacterium]|nr:hypothetical protein [Lachnospiraceae bacterium]